MEHSLLGLDYCLNGLRITGSIILQKKQLLLTNRKHNTVAQHNMPAQGNDQLLEGSMCTGHQSQSELGLLLECNDELETILPEGLNMAQVGSFELNLVRAACNGLRVGGV